MTEALRVFFLSTSLPPHADSQTIRSVNLLHALSGRDWEWTFIAPGTPGGGDSWRAALPTDACYYHTGPTAGERAEVASRHVPLIGGRSGWAVRNAVYRLGLPDHYFGWQRAALRVAQTAMEVRGAPHVIVSSSGSPAAHVAAAQLSRRTGAPWVADFGDPWHLVDREIRPWLAPLSKRMERRTIKTAARLIYTTRETLLANRAWLGALERAEVIPYGFRRGDITPVTEHADRPLEIAHVGAAYVANRNLIPTIRAAASLAATGRPVRLSIVGNQSAQFAAEARQVGLASARFVDRVSFEESLRWLNRTDIIVVVGNAAPLQIPGKVFTAIGSGRPILYIGQRSGHDDPAAQLLRPLPGVLCVQNVEREIADAIDALRTCFGQWSAAARARLDLPCVQALEARRLSEQFGMILREVATR